MRRIGILGGGQLGRMLALAGYPLQIHCRVWDPAGDACAGQVCPLIPAPYSDPSALRQFLEGIECATYEFENIDLTTVQAVAQYVPVHPNPSALRLFQDRLTEKQTLRQYGIATPAFAEIDLDNPQPALDHVGLPAVVKTRRFGYDGKGQVVVHSLEEFHSALTRLSISAPLLVEEFVPFEREVSTIGVRGMSGEFVCYPLIENLHLDGILRLSLAPAESSSLLQTATTHMRQLMSALDYVGVMTIEWFQVGDQLLANEVAPRVHNSGHWTIEGAETSQFENHLRALLGLPLGSTAPRGYSAMVNLIGAIPEPKNILQVPNAHLHLYGKEPRSGRKVGHITIRTDTLAERTERLLQLLQVLQDTLGEGYGYEHLSHFLSQS